jgi:hypothetical protein
VNLPNAKWLADGLSSRSTPRSGEVGAGPVGDPRVLAHLEADAHVVDVEQEVADGVAGGAALEHVALPAGHGLNQRGS